MPNDRLQFICFNKFTIRTGGHDKAARHIKARTRQADQVRALAASIFESCFGGGEGNDVHNAIIAQNRMFYVCGMKLAYCDGPPDDYKVAFGEANWFTETQSNKCRCEPKAKQSPGNRCVSVARGLLRRVSDPPRN